MELYQATLCFCSCLAHHTMKAKCAFSDAHEKNSSKFEDILSFFCYGGVHKSKILIRDLIVEILTRVVFKKKKKKSLFEGVQLIKTYRLTAEINRIFYRHYFSFTTPYYFFLLLLPIMHSVYIYIFFFGFDQRIISVSWILAFKMHFSIKEMPS